MSGPDAGETRAITLLALAGFVSAAAFRVCDPMLPQLARVFETSTGTAARVVTAFSVAYGLLQALYGPVGDRYGKYRVVAAATLACSLGNAGAALAPTLGWLVACRALSGATGAAIVPLSMAWIGDTVPYERRQTTLARFMTGTILGMTAGTLVGGLFADTVGWRWAFVLLVAGYLGVGLLLRGELARHRRRAAQARSEATPPSGPAPRFWAQTRAVLADPWARTILLVVFLEGCVVFGTLAFIPAYLHRRFGVSLTVAGLIVGTFGLGGLLYTVLARRLLERLHERGFAVAGGLALGLAFAVLALGPAWGWALPASSAAGFGFYMLHNTLQTNATQMAPTARGTAVSLFASALFMGQALGVAAAGALVDRASATWLFALTAMAAPAIGAWMSRALRSRPSGLGRR